MLSVITHKSCTLESAKKHTKILRLGSGTQGFTGVDDQNEILEDLLKGDDGGLR